MRASLVLAFVAVLATLGVRAWAADDAWPVEVSAATIVQRPAAAPWPVRVHPPDPARETPVSGPGVSAPEAGLVRRLMATGRAAGLAGVIYDNRDRGHSVLPADDFPTLRPTRYAARLREANLDTGAAGRFRFPQPTLGNSSTAITRGPFPRSLARVALADPFAAARAHALYAANHLYVYPEHRDHDPDVGDLLTANTPLFVVSQGSSYSDQPFLRALAMTLAAFQPATRAKLEAEGLVAPTLQMILRRSLKRVTGDAAYLSARAHPPVFSQDRLRPGAMISLANSLAPDAIPPLVRLQVVEDFSARPGLDYLATGLGEEVFTTPSAIARLWRSFAYRRTLVLDAGATRDPSGRSLRFHWVLLRGDPDRVDIVTAGPDGVRAMLEVDWHPVRRDPVTGLATNRVDLAVFADNGETLSAPATVSIVFPVHQVRRYAADGAGGLRLETLRYDSPDPATARLRDPLLWPEADWQDRLIYRRDGTLAEIRRMGPDGRRRVLRPVAGGFVDAGAPSGPPLRHAVVADTEGRPRLVLTGAGAGNQ